MTARSVLDAPLTEVASLLRTRELSASELTGMTLARLHELNDRTGAYYCAFDAEALASARSADRDIGRGIYKGPLHGIPLAVKDVIDFGPTTCGSKSMRDHVAIEPATSVSRLMTAGAVIIGKAATYEFAVGRPTPESFFPAARNPWDLERDPGGSSSGSAVAVATGTAFGALGTDSGGSVRSPSFHCGVFGIKPTYGRVSRAGVFPFSWSFDTVGVLARSARDAAVILGACAGHDPRDETSAARSDSDFLAEIDAGLEGLSVGVPRAFFEDTCDAEILSNFDDAVEVMRTLGAEVRSVEFVDSHHAQSTFWVQAAADFAAIHRQRYLRSGADYGLSVRHLVETGHLIDGWAYVQALRSRASIRRRIEATFDEVDLLMLPTSPRLNGRVDSDPGGHDFLTAEPGGYTYPFNMAGGPALAVPSGFSSGGLPIGFQLAGAPWSEARLFRAAEAYAEATSWSARLPDVLGAGMGA